MGGVGTAAAVAFGLLAAASFAAAALIQQRATLAIPDRLALRPALLLALVRRPLWLAGAGAMLGGYLLQALALGFGPVALVQPIVATELAFAVPLSILTGHRRAGAREWAGTALTVGGVGAFLAAAAPSPGRADPGSLRWIVLLLPALTLMAAIATLAARRKGPVRAGLLGVDAAIAFGLLAVLTKTVAHLIGQGAPSLFTRFEPYAIVGVGVLGLLCSQSAYQAAPLPSSLPFVVVVEPAIAVVLGTTLLDERIGLAGPAALVEAAGVLAVVAGVVLLTRSPLVRSIYEHDAAWATTTDGGGSEERGGSDHLAAVRGPSDGAP